MARSDAADLETGSGPGADAEPFVTVAVCTRDRVADLRSTLPAILSQFSSRTWELLLIDNGSSDGTDRVLAELSEVRSTAAARRYALEPEPGADRARALALREARGEVVVFADDDVTPLPGWLEAYVQAFSDPAVMGAGGRISPQLPEDVAEWVRLLAAQIGGPPGRYDFGREAGPIQPRRQSTPFGGNMALRRSAALEIGGFSEDFGYGRRIIPGEDTEICLRMLQAGQSVQYVPAAVVLHRIPESKLTLEYFCTWWRGLGRSRAIQHSKSSMASVGRSEGPAKALSQWMKYSLRKRRYAPFSPKWLRALQRQQVATGELSQFFGR